MKLDERPRDVEREYRQKRMARIRSGAGGFHRNVVRRPVRSQVKVQLRKEYAR